MLLSQFEYRFPTEESCIDYFKDVRLKELGVCPKCGHMEYYWLTGKQTFECKSCRHRIPLTKGTVMEHSKLPMRTWFYTMHLMTSIKQVLSAKGVQHQLHMSEYPPVWLMMMKLRNIIINHTGGYSDMCSWCYTSLAERTCLMEVIRCIV